MSTSAVACVRVVESSQKRQCVIDGDRTLTHKRARARTRTRTQNTSDDESRTHARTCTHTHTHTPVAMNATIRNDVRGARRGRECVSDSVRACACVGDETTPSAGEASAAAVRDYDRATPVSATFACGVSR